MVEQRSPKPLTWVRFLVPPQNKIIPLGIILFLLGCTVSQLLGSRRESNDGACVNQ